MIRICFTKLQIMSLGHSNVSVSLQDKSGVCPPAHDGGWFRQDTHRNNGLDSSRLCVARGSILTIFTCDGVMVTERKPTSSFLRITGARYLSEQMGGRDSAMLRPCRCVWSKW